MGGERKTRRRVLVLAVLVSLGVLVLGGGVVAGACKVALNCGLGESSDVLEVAPGEIALPEGFRAEPAATGLSQPTDFDFLPDGRILVAERQGLVRVAEDGLVADQPLLDLRDRVNVEFFRGLVAIAVDPDFETNGFVYIVYTVRKLDEDPKGPTVVRVSRFALTDSSAGPEEVILGAAGDETTSCADLAPTADCLPSEVDHVGADIAFADDGTLFVGTGDGGGVEAVEEIAFLAQDPDALGGKILRVTRDGAGVEGNPFFDGDASANRSKVWALGLRNPFRLALAPESDLPVVGDVGWRMADEIDVAPAGSNLGWPCIEGSERTIEYRETARCQDFYREDPELVPPTITLLQPDAVSVTGGDFYEGRMYPEEYRGAYFFADWGRSWIRTARVEADTGTLEGTPAPFAENAGGPVALRVGPDGQLYVLSLNYGQLNRIEYEDS